MTHSCPAQHDLLPALHCESIKRVQKHPEYVRVRHKEMLEDHNRQVVSAGGGHAPRPAPRRCRAAVRRCKHVKDKSLKTLVSLKIGTTHMSQFWCAAGSVLLCDICSEKHSKQNGHPFCKRVLNALRTSSSLLV